MDANMDVLPQVLRNAQRGAPRVDQEYRTGPWDAEEIAKLKNIIESFQNNKSRIHWGEVVGAMNRSRREVDLHYNRIRRGKMHTGPFTEAEDQLILQRVTEYRASGKKQGFWKSLENEMNRSTWAIGHRWTSVLSRQLPGPTLIDEDKVEDDDSSEHGGAKPTTSGVGSAKKRKWIDMSIDKTPYKNGSWTAEEVDQLMELVAYQGVAYEEDDSPYKKPFKVNWHTISQQVGREKGVCANKHKSVMRRQLKKTEFTEEEDAIIAQRLKEWGGSGHGMWASIARELGRDGVLTQVYWNGKLQASGGGGSSSNEGVIVSKHALTNTGISSLRAKPMYSRAEALALGHDSGDSSDDEGARVHNI